MRPLLPFLGCILLCACQTTKDVTRKTADATAGAVGSTWQTLGEAADGLSFWKKPKHLYAPAEPPRELRAAWVATVANIDWPSRPGLPVARQIDEMHAILDEAVELNLNAIILQVRPAADALYASELEPWSEYLTGEQGLPPADYYDPLATWVTEAHRRGIELHAWFNPYRARHSGAKSPNAPNHVSQTMPEAVRRFNNWEWLDPAEPRASEHTLNVILDVVRRYDIDGVHLDDYFYPYAAYLKGEGAQAKDFPDEAAWNRYQQSGGQLSRGDWRRDNVNRMIHDLYLGIKATKPHVKFGISPFGIARPGLPPEVETGFNQYEELYADAQLWLNNGWLDYWTPQLYWKIDSKQPYKALLNWWVSQNAFNRHVWPGLFTSRVSPDATGDDPQKWPAEEIVNQIQVTRDAPGASGHVHFSMVALLKNRAGISETLKSGPYANQVLIPATPWLANPGHPAVPDVQAYVRPNGSVSVTWFSQDMTPPTWWGVWAQQAGQWHFRVFPSQVRSLLIDSPVQGISVIAVDRLGRTSPSKPALVIKSK